MHNQISEIPIDKFDLSLNRMRVTNMRRILQVEKSMRLHGQLQPVVARVHEAGVQLIDGFKRLYNRKRRHSALGYKTIDEFNEIIINFNNAA